MLSLFSRRPPRKPICGGKRLSLEWLECRLTLSGNPFISEFMAANSRTLMDGNGEFPDWIEIHNPNNSDFDIGGWYLTDNPARLTKWRVPAGTILAPYEYKIIFCDDGFTTFPPGELHTTFKLDKDGEYVALVEADGATIASEYGPGGTDFPVQTEDVSYGRSMTAASVVASSAFGSNAEGFAYADDLIAAVASGTAASGAWSATAGRSGGGLSVTTTMSSSKTINGGFSRSVTITTTGTYTFSADAKLALTSGSSYNLAATDTGTAYLIVKNAGGSTVLQKTFVQSGNGTAKSVTSPWTALGGNVTLAPGTYTVILALMDSTRVSGTGPKYIDAYFDNFSVASAEAVTGEPRYFAAPTPGAINGAGLLGIIEDRVQFSQEHGFFNSALDVTLSIATPDATIRYTTDGSEPATDTGTLYTGPIHISATTVLRARAFKTDYHPSQVETTSYFFLADVVTQSPTGAAPAGWPAAGWLSGISMSHFLSYGMDPDIVNNPTWGPMMIQALQSIPTMSLATDVRNLFDPASGIIVNSNFSGIAWERAASLELVNPDGSTGFQTDVGIRIRGSASTTDSPTVKYGLRVYFDDEYGEGKLAYPLFGAEGADMFDKIDLRTTQNWSWSKDADTNATFLRDIFSRDTQGAMGEPYARGRVYHLYINGQYWGLYETDERPDADFAASYMGGTKDDYDVVKVTRDVTSGIEYSVDTADGNLNAWQDLWNQTMAMWTVNYFQPAPEMTVTDLVAAESVVADRSLQAQAITAGSSTINYVNPSGGDGGHFASSAFPGTALSADSDNFVIEVMGTIKLATSGNWTFGVSAGETFSFELSNGISTYTFTHTGTGSVTDVLRTFNVSAGDYNLRIVYFDDAGGANLELYAAAGAYSAFDSAAFHLIGDTAGGGIAFSGMASDVAYNRVQGLNPDGTDNPNFDKLLDVRNLVDYMLTIFYTGNYDAPVSGWFGNLQPNNFFAIYNHRNPDGFKFIAHDSEHTLNCGVSWNSSGNNRLGPYPSGSPNNFPDGFLDSNPQLFHQKLYLNPRYRQAFADRAKELTTGTGALTPAACLNRYDARKAEYLLGVIAEAARWGDYLYEQNGSSPQCTPANWNTAVAAERTLIPGRTAVLVSQLQAFSPTLYPETFSAGPSQWNAAGAAGLTLKIGPDGMTHLYITGSSTDAVTPHLASKVISIDIIGRQDVDDALTIDFTAGNPLPAGGIVFDGGAGSAGNSLIIIGTSANDDVLMLGGQLTVNASAPIKLTNVALFGLNLGAGSNALRIDHATLRISQANAISPGTNATIDAGALDLNGASDVLGNILLLSGGIFNGTLCADSYTIESGIVTANIVGPGDLQKTSASEAAAGAVNVPNVIVQGGQLTVTSVYAGTLTVAAGATVTIAPIASGPLGAPVAQNDIAQPVVLSTGLEDATDAKAAQVPVDEEQEAANESGCWSALTYVEAAALPPVANDAILDAVTTRGVIRVTPAPNVVPIKETFRAQAAAPAVAPQRMAAAVASDATSLAFVFADNAPRAFVPAMRAPAKTSIFDSLLERLIGAAASEKRTYTPGAGDRLARREAVQGIFDNAGFQANRALAEHIPAGRRDKVLEKAVDQVLAKGDNAVFTEGDEAVWAML